MQTLEVKSASVLGSPPGPKPPTDTGLDDWILSCQKVLAVVMCINAVALPLPITWSWSALIVGLVVWMIWKISLLVRYRRNFKWLELGPLALPLVIFAFATTISGLPSWGGHDIPDLTFDDKIQSLISLRTLIVYFWAYDVFYNLPELRRVAIAWMLLSSSFAGLFGAYEQVFDWHPGFKFLRALASRAAPWLLPGKCKSFACSPWGLLSIEAIVCFPDLVEQILLFANSAG